MKDWWADALSMRLEGYSYDLISERFKASPQRIQQILCPPGLIRKQVLAQAQECCQRCGIRVGNQGLGHFHFGDTMGLELLCLHCHITQHPYDGDDGRVGLLEETQRMVLLYKVIREGKE